MRRVTLDQSEDSQDNLLFHLARYKFIARLVKLSDRLIEIGCGTGYGARFLANYVSEVLAVDAETKVIDYAKKRFPKRNLSYAYEIGEAGLFDVVVCLEVIEHMDVDQGRELLATMRRLMRPGAVAFISTPRKIDNPSENRRKFHVHEYTFQEYRAILETTFARALVFTQVDEIISTHHPDCAWNFVALCYD
jgi:2-polyprenyl-3-methyl-5-hydroxy-6-metoxy-1,4-benzoquinol methylase